MFLRNGPRRPTVRVQNTRLHPPRLAQQRCAKHDQVQPKSLFPIASRLAPAGSCIGGFRTQAPETLHNCGRSACRQGMTESVKASPLSCPERKADGFIHAQSRIITVGKYTFMRKPDRDDLFSAA